jgi:hypothetical protein
VFSAIFVGSWVLLILFVLCYAAAGALGAGFGRMNPGSVPH